MPYRTFYLATNNADEAGWIADKDLSSYPDQKLRTFQQLSDLLLSLMSDPEGFREESIETKNVILIFLVKTDKMLDLCTLEGMRFLHENQKSRQAVTEKFSGILDLGYAHRPTGAELQEYQKLYCRHRTSFDAFEGPSHSEVWDPDTIELIGQIPIDSRLHESWADMEKFLESIKVKE